MAYDQGNYQPPSRPYNGRAAAPPSQNYYPPGPQQQYGGNGGYDQYAQDDGYGYGAEGYDQGYGQQDYGYQQQPPPMNGGHRGAPGRGGPPQNNGYGNGGGRGGPDPRGGGGNRSRGGDPYGGRPQQGPPGGAYNGQNGRGGAPPRGERPPHPGRSGSSDPGGELKRGRPIDDNNADATPARQQRPPVQQPLSPQGGAWDNPFPGFPGAKKKTSLSEEQKIVQGMANMDMNGPPRPRTAGGGQGQDYRRPQPGQGDYGRPSGDSQRGPSRGPPGAAYTPQGQGYSGQRQPPRGPPRQNNYNGSDPGFSGQMSPSRDDFGPPSRSNTMPNDITPPMGGQNPAPRYPVGDVGPSAPYNGPVGRGPPRPSTATGSRPSQQRGYQQEPPSQQSYQNLEVGGQQASHQHSASISDLYDDYFQDDDHGHHSARGSQETPGSLQGNPMDNIGGPMPTRQQVNGNTPMSKMKSQPDLRAQVQAQSAVYEMAGDAPPLPNEFDQGGYNQQYDQYDQGQQNGYTENVGNEYDQGYNQGGQQGYGQRRPGPPGPPGPPPQRGLPNGPGPNGMMLPPRTNSLPKQQPQDQGMPSHPPPVRAGLIQGNGNLASNKPAPVRNYGGSPANGPPPVSQQQQQQQQAPPVQSRQSLPQNQPGVPPPVTLDEIERLKAIVKVNPTDMNAQLTLARKWMEAADVLVPAIPDGRARTKARERYVMDASKMLKKLCSGPTPFAEAQFFYADCLGRGALGLEPDNKQAFMLYQSAAKAGHSAAAYRTAVCCELGNEEGGGTHKDPLKAIQWYKRAATLGDTPAMYKMGMIQLKGLLGQQKNPREAVGWLKRAAEHADAENPHALHELGLLYEAQQPPDGSGTIIRDENYAFTLFQQSADLGYKFSQFRLGCAFEYGLLGRPVSPRDSIMWYSRAAVQEEHQSELALSGWYLTGSEGVLGQSDTEAYLWARKAAMAGLAKAEYAMGYFTEVGIGSPSDLEGAKRWYWRAAGMFILLLCNNLF